MAQALTGIQKAAILMIALGAESSAQVVKHLADGRDRAVDTRNV